MPRQQIAPTPLRFLAILLAFLLVPASQAATPGQPRVSDAPQGLASLALDAQAAISASLGQDQPAYHARRAGAALRLDNPAHGLKARFTAQGLTLESGGARLRLQTQGLGYGAHIQALPAAEPKMRANRVEYHRGRLREWYINGPAGLEQGFTLASPPAPATGEALTLTLALNGDLRARPASEGLDLVRDGQPALRYRGLIAYDARGRALPAWWQVEGGTVQLRIDDQGADYPLTIDPFIQQAKLSASDGAALDTFGRSVAVSGDTVVVGAAGAAIGTNDEQGAAYVFVKPASGWASTSSFDAKLTASDGARLDNFGVAVAVSGDTVVVVAGSAVVGTSLDLGAAYVFVKPASGWASTSIFNAKLSASDGAGDQVISVTASGDTVVLGARGAQGAAYVFVKPPSGWATTSSVDAKLTASDGVAEDEFGASVAMSGDTVIVGAGSATIGTAFAQGAAYVFVKPASGWASTSNFDAKLTASDGASFDEFGGSVAVSGDTVVVGAAFTNLGVNENQGAAYVFVKPASGWASTSSFDAELSASDGTPFDRFGKSVAARGDTVVVGSEGEGAAYVFVKPELGWTSTSSFDAKLSASDGANGDEFGGAVAVSGDTLVVAAIGATIGANAFQGAAYVFVTDTPPVDPPVDPPVFCRGVLATIVGTVGADTLVGSAARDVIVGLGGNDQIIGGDGNDLICAGPGDDRVSGGSGRDRLDGDAGRDTLLGGTGRDRLNGGSGRDRCIGGAGTDSAIKCATVRSVP